MQMLSPELAQALDGLAASGAPKVKLAVHRPHGRPAGPGLLLSILCFIRLGIQLQSLLVLRARLGNEHGRWKPVYTDFVKVWLATGGRCSFACVLVVCWP